MIIDLIPEMELLIGTYRDNEVHPAHLFTQLLEELKEQRFVIKTLSLSPLKPEHVEQLVAESLQSSLDSGNLRDHSSLARMVMEKTAGNPFFVGEFLRTLVLENLLRFDLKERRWIYSEQEIRGKDITGSVVELVVGHMKKLPEKTQKVLRLAACIGNVFARDTLAHVSQMSPEETGKALWPALREGMLFPVSKSAGFKFLHDRVQQAAYELIDQNQKELVHLKVGRLLLANLDIEAREEQLFELVGHLNKGRSLIIDGTEKLELCRLNLRAGKKARESGAFQTALEFLNVSRELLPEDSWESSYEFTFEIYFRNSEISYVATEFETMDNLSEICLVRAQNTIDRVKIYELKALSFFAQGRMQDTLDIGLEGLRMLGIRFPKKRTIPYILAAALKTRFMLRGKQPEVLVDLPKMKNPGMILAMQIFMIISPAAYWLKEPLLALIAFKMVDLSIEYGNSPLSPAGYSMYGLINTSILGKVDIGYRFGQVGYKLGLEAFAKEFRAPAITLKNFGSLHHKEHMRGAVKGEGSQMHALQAALETGKLEHAGLALINYSYFVFYCGVALSRATDELRTHVELCRQYHQKASRTIVAVSLQNLLNYQNESENPVILNGDAFNEGIIPELRKSGEETALGLIHVYKLQLCYHFGEFALALENMETANQYMDALVGMPHLPLLLTYNSLSRLAMANSTSKSERRQILRIVAANQKKLKVWAANGPANYLNKYNLVEAERARVQGRDRIAMDFYERAAKGARENEFVQEEALANELFARFWLEKETFLYARLHMKEARRLYNQWGAIGKVSYLKEKYPELMSRERGESNADSFGGVAAGRSRGRITEGGGEINSTSSSRTTGGTIDLGTVVKATRTMAGEMEISGLLGNLMDIVMENAGARRGFLFLERDGELTLVSRNDTERESRETHLNFSLLEIESQGGMLATSVVRYVARMKESVVLNDAEKDERFSRDPYIAQYNPRSILCTPIIHQGILTGLLYLENNLMSDVFTEKGLEVLNMLTSQAALTLENANLSLMKELSITRERNRIHADLHDFLGGSLTDLSLLVKKMKSGVTSPEGGKLTAELELNVQQIVRNYRSCLTNAQDLDLLVEDFNYGLNMILLRRYENSDRMLNFKSAPEVTEILRKALNVDIRNVLHAIATEMATNDLKYGKGEAEWSLRISPLPERNVILEFSSGSNYDAESQTEGRGTGNIKSRVTEVGGVLETQLSVGGFRALVRLPWK